MADASNDCGDDSNFLNDLIRVRLDMEEEFAAGKIKKKLLWDNVVEKIKEKNPNLNLSRDYIVRKYLNLMTTYKRIITRNKEPGKRTTTWEFFDDFNEVYGNKYSIGQSMCIHLSVDKGSSALTEIEECDPYYEMIEINETKCEPFGDSIDLNDIKCEPCDDSITCDGLTESQDRFLKTEAIFSRSDDKSTTTAVNIKCEPSDDSMEFDRNISPGPPAKKNCSNEILGYLKRESVRKQKRHEDIMAFEKKKIQLQEKKIKAMMELKDVLENRVANKLS